jgi:hypothetical protein
MREGITVKINRQVLRVAAVVDGDNIFRNAEGRRISPDIDLFANALRERGVNSTTICQNFFRDVDRNNWQRIPNLRTARAGENCDRKVMLIAIDYVMSGLDWLIIASGDADYLPLVEAAQHAGTRVEIWALRCAASKQLIYAVDSVRWIDDLIVTNAHRPFLDRSSITSIDGMAA